MLVRVVFASTALMLSAQTVAAQTLEEGVAWPRG
jgi:hypothetical protein